MEQAPSASSADATPPSRPSFTLTGPSVTLDPRTHAIRADLADVRLADRVFAPHYAAPVAVDLRQAADLRAGPEADADVLACLPAGARFEVLERAGDRLWGTAPEVGLAGYLDAGAA